MSTVSYQSHKTWNRQQKNLGAGPYQSVLNDHHVIICIHLESVIEASMGENSWIWLYSLLLFRCIMNRHHHPSLQIFLLLFLKMKLKHFTVLNIAQQSFSNRVKSYHEFVEWNGSKAMLSRINYIVNRQSPSLIVIFHWKAKINYEINKLCVCVYRCQIP